MPDLDYDLAFCYECCYFILDLGEGDWSDYTPGYPARVGCMKRHWSLGEGEQMPEFRKAIRSARRCPDFRPLPKQD